MRPILLEISAFGPYAEKVQIPMDKLGDRGLYLITGDTGAGKTTIFDAITFALFGEASGKNRESTMFRSKYALPETPTYVKLVFLHNTKEYTITRNPEYERATKKGDGMTTQKADAEFVYPDGRVVAKVRDVNQAVKEILGIDRDQFSQIAMIAQGDFLKLLLADTKERQVIFRDLFKTGYYQTLQERFKQESGKVSQEWEQQNVSMKQYVNGILCDEEDLLKSEVSRAKDGELSLLDTKAVLEALLKADAERTKEMEAATAKLDKALENINGKENLFAEKEKRKEELHFAKNSYAKKSEEVQGFVETFATEKEKQSAKEKLIEARILATKEDLKGLENAGEHKERILRLQAEQKSCKSDLLQLQKEIQDYRNLERKFVGVQRNYVLQMKRATEAQEAYQALYKAFLDAQAGVLASTLTEGAPCPVCGSTSHPSPCITVLSAPDKEAVETAEAATKEAREFAVRLSNETSGFKGNLDAQGKGIQEKAKTLFADAKLPDVSGAPDHGLAFVHFVDTLLENKLVVVNDTLQKLQGEMDLEEARILRKANLQRQLQMQEETFALEKTNGLKRLQALEETHAKNQKELGTLEGVCKALTKQIEEMPQIDIVALSLEKQELLEKRQIIAKKQKDIYARLTSNKATLQHILEKEAMIGALEEKLIWVRALSNTANGNLSGKEKVMLETYVQMTFFDRILERANTRLMIMTGGQYELKRQMIASNNRSQSGLELDVLDHYNGTTRSVKTLSGGESFKASLSLALGLSDEIQSNAGGIRLDTMFVDEGFGSLDEESLQQAIRALASLAEGNRLVGIISHVEALKTKIDKQIVVTKDKTGGSTCFIDTTLI